MALLDMNETNYSRNQVQPNLKKKKSMISNWPSTVILVTTTVLPNLWSQIVS